MNGLLNFRNEVRLPILIGAPKKKMLFAVVAGSIFVLIGFWLIGDPDEHTRKFLTVAEWGWLCIIFFGACTIIGLASLVSRRPSLALLQDGLSYEPLFGKNFSVRWADIANVDIWSVSAAGQTTTGLLITTRDGTVKKLPEFEKSADVIKNMITFCLDHAPGIQKET
jgi:hypothetical protein